MGCGAVRPKADLRRLVLDGEHVVIDVSGSSPGRGAYVCDVTCAERAVARRAFGRAFRRAVEVSPDFVDSLRN